MIVARYYGAKLNEDVSTTVHTAVTISLISGLFLVVLGFFTSRTLLEWMGTPEDVIDKSVIYMQIYFAGMPVIMAYNFGSAILRAIGDTKRPLYFLSMSGVVNVVLNLIFVIYFHMDVAGVALATVLSQCISTALVLRCLMKMDGPLKLSLSKLRIDKRKTLQIIKIGLPAGLQGAIFSLSNVLIQSSVNSFGSIAMAGNTASSNIEGFVYAAMNAIYQTNLSFASQNVGAEKYGRVNKILYICLGTVTIVGMSLGFLAFLAGKNLLGIYSSDPEVLTYGMLRMSIICTMYFMCGWMDTMVGSLRGLGYSILPMIVSLTGACGLRVLWIFTVFAHYKTLTSLYLSYPVTWLITGAAHMICYRIIYRKIVKKKIGKI